jgi:hypothetical protein
MESEVLVYLSKLKKYFETNKEARDYLINDLPEDIFMERVSEIAEKNFLEKGDPTLSMAQFEFIKKVLEVEHGVSVTIYNEPMIFIDKRGLETIIKK